MLAAVFPSLAFSQSLQPICNETEKKEYGYELERALIKGGAVFLSGALDGVSETLVWHYPQFQAVHPNARPGYWNPYQSWTNKYNSSRFFLFGAITISVFEKRRKWWTYPAEFVAGGLVRSAGFHAAYSGLYGHK
jgi:hypothetical protein